MSQRSSREVCDQCSRPARVCLCYALPSRKLHPPCRVIILQTRAEAKARVGTARLVPLVLTDCDVRVTSRIHDLSEEIANLLTSDSVLLFPGRHAAPLHHVLERGSQNISDNNHIQDGFTAPSPSPSGRHPSFPKAIVLLDGSWKGAKRLLAKCPALERLQMASLPENCLAAFQPLFLARPPPKKFSGMQPTFRFAKKSDTNLLDRLMRFQARRPLFCDQETSLRVPWALPCGLY